MNSGTKRIPPITGYSFHTKHNSPSGAIKTDKKAKV
jgi:hypothetical protein